MWDSVSLHFKQIFQSWVTDPHNRIRTVNKINSEIEN